MEEKSLLEKLKQEYDLPQVDIRTISPLNLAFVGDGIFDLIIRTILVERANRPAHELHKKKSAIVKAQTQARLSEVLEEVLNEEELAVYKRGRNAKSGTSAKNASIVDYRKATGFEALLGYLYLSGQEDRLLMLVKIGLSRLELMP
ncbi:MAG: ribonuclease III [Lachnospiraceae bacterium]|nr:ribonuclease III [Lachnospiraceae bacterium]